MFHDVLQKLDLVVQVVAEDPQGLFLKDAPAHIVVDRAVVVAAVRRNGCSLEFVDEKLRADKEMLGEDFGCSFFSAPE